MKPKICFVILYACLAGVVRDVYSQPGSDECRRATQAVVVAQQAVNDAQNSPNFSPSKFITVKKNLEDARAFQSKACSKNGASYVQVADHPFDIVADLFDDNGVPMKPKWKSQKVSGALPDCLNGVEIPFLPPLTYRRKR